MNSKAIFFSGLLAAAMCVACSDDNVDGAAGAKSISGTIVEVNGYGQPIPSFTPKQMAEAGFDYADLINVTIGDSIRLTNLPYVTSFNEVAILGPSYVDYNARGDDYGFAMLNGDFHYYIGGEVGDTVTMTLAEKGGYKETYELMKSVYQTERSAGETAEEYANFRMVTTTGVKPGVLYRSSNPLNCDKNPGRYSVADSLAQSVGIATEIDLADTDAKVEAYINGEGYASAYCPQLFRNGKTKCCGMNANAFCDDSRTKLADAARFMIANKSPYLIHCNEGKDRCGFVSMLLEALAGAGIDELRRDYMVTMLNFYKIDDGGASYNLRQQLSIDRMIWLLCNEEALDDYKKIDWSTVGVSSYASQSHSLQSATLQAAARKYLKEGGLTDQEVDQLYTILTEGKLSD